MRLSVDRLGDGRRQPARAARAAGTPGMGRNNSCPYLDRQVNLVFLPEIRGPATAGGVAISRNEINPRWGEVDLRSRGASISKIEIELRWGEIDRRKRGVDLRSGGVGTRDREVGLRF